MRLAILLLSSLILSGCHFLTDKQLDQKIKDANYAGMIVGYEYAQAEASARYEDFIKELKQPLRLESEHIEDEVEDFELAMRN